MRSVASLLIALLFMAPYAPHAAPPQRSAIPLPYHIHGATMYPYFEQGSTTYHGSAWAHVNFTPYIDMIVAEAVLGHINVLRPTDYLDGAGTDAYNTTIWANMDYLFTTANAHGINVEIDMSAYRNWLIKNNYSPYNPANWQSFVPFVVNRYKAMPNLSLWAIAGELPNVNQSGYIPPAQQLAFYDGVSRQIAALDTSHYISTGGLGYLNWAGGIDWQDIYNLPYITLPAIHVYSSGDLTVSLPMVAQYATSINKPWYIEEFGYKQSDTDATRAGEYQTIYNTGAAPCSGCEASLGAIFWNLGPESVSSNSNTYDAGLQTPGTWQVIQGNV